MTTGSQLVLGDWPRNNLRFCGTFDADTSTITTLTDYGVQAGLTLGAIPEATPEITGVYLVCVKAGTGVSFPTSVERASPKATGSWPLTKLGNLSMLVKAVEEEAVAGPLS